MKRSMNSTAALVAGTLVTWLGTAVATEMQDRYASLAASDESSAQQWFELAQQAREAGETGVAGDALDAAVAAGLSPVRSGLERARLHVATGKPGEAVSALEALAASGFAAPPVITGDPVLSSMQGRPDYEALIETMSRQAYPCRYDEAFRAFDFWVGDWDVHLANGQYAGDNSIESAESGCVLIENWTGASGGTGMSVNYLDKATGEWVQVWNSEGGAQISIRGGLTDEGMLLTGHIHYIANGTTAPFRGLWTPLPDGRVRQFFEQSNDDGATWAPWFEGFYTRKHANE